MKKLDDKFMVKKCGNKDKFELFFPSSCYKDDISVKQIEVLAIRNDKGVPITQFPMLPLLKEEKVQKKFLKNNERFETVFKKVHLSVFVPMYKEGAYVYTCRSYKNVIKAIKVAIRENYESDYLDKLKLDSIDDLPDEYYGKIQEDINQFMESFDGFKIDFPEIPNICCRTDYAGFKGEKEFELVGVDFYQLDKEAISKKDLARINKAVSFKKSKSKGTSEK